MGSMTWDIIGNTWASDLLKQHIASGRVRHAYLLTGPDGIGKRTLALRFVKALNCTQPPRPGEFCGECSTCIRIEERVYPDLHIVEVGQFDEQRGSTSSEISIEQIIALQKKLALTSYEGSWRVGLILKFWQASLSAANALLKTLEEPSPNVVLLLTSRTADDLLPTIVSRCEVLHMRPLSKQTVEEGLTSAGVEAEQAEMLASVSAGRPGFAMRLIEDPDQLKQRSERIRELIDLLTSNRSERFDYVNKFHPQTGETLKDVRDEVIALLELWLAIWRDVFLIQLDRADRVQNKDVQDALVELAGDIERAQTIKVLGDVEATMGAIQDYANIRLTLENLMLAMPRRRSYTPGGAQ
jgi:DNA polymerase-3 subunit delta'